MHYPIRVLFLCTGNSCRSQMAETLLRHYGGGDFEICSAGTDPKPVHPMAIEVMQELGIDIADYRSTHLDAYGDRTFDYIITVCDRARDNCPTFPGDVERIHWGFDDPAAADGDDESRRRVFRRVRSEIAERVRRWVTVQRKALKDRGLLNEVTSPGP